MDQTSSNNMFDVVPYNKDQAYNKSEPCEITAKWQAVHLHSP